MKKGSAGLGVRLLWVWVLRPLLPAVWSLASSQASPNNTLFTFLFSPVSLFCSSVPSRTPHYISSPCPLRLLLTGTLSQPCLVFGGRGSLRRTHQVLCSMPLVRHVPGVFVMITLEFWVFTRVLKCRFHHIMWRKHVMNMTKHCRCWPWSAGWGRVCQVSALLSYSFPSFSYCTVWKAVSLHSSHVRRGDCAPPL